MRRRDWAGTVLVASLVALVSLLPNHRLLFGFLLAATAISGLLIACDARKVGRSARTDTQVTKPGEIQKGSDPAS